MMSRCQECKCNSDTTSSTEFNKNLCDDCYTEYRATIQHMFGLKDLYDVKLNLNDELYSQEKLIELSKGCDGILSALTDKLDE